MHPLVLSLLHILSGHLVGLGKTVLVACDSWLSFILNTRLLVHQLALISTVVHHFKEGLALEALLHQTCIGDLAFLKLSHYVLVQVICHCFRLISVCVRAYVLVRAFESQSNLIKIFINNYYCSKKDRHFVL